MKTIGLIGGMSWESTVTYYQQINQRMNQALGGLHSAKILLSSVDFHQIEQYQSQNQWGKATELLTEEAIKLEQSGADFILLCTNTMHKVFEQIQAGISIPLLHIADATVQQLQTQQIKKVGLLGTKYTMEQTFYKERIIQAGIDVLVPNEAGIERINKVIFEELVLGKITIDAKKEYLSIINQLIHAGAEAIILGCTEIGLLVQQADVQVPVFDTTFIHAEKAVENALQSI